MTEACVAISFESALASPRRRHGGCLHPLRQMRRGLPGHGSRRADATNSGKIRSPSSAASSTFCAAAKATTRRANGRAAACSPANASRPATTASIRAFLLHMARVAMVRAKDDAPTQRRKGVEGFRHVAHDVKHISRIQLDDVLLERLGQGAKQAARRPRPRPISSSIPAAMCSRRRISRCLALDIMDATRRPLRGDGRPDPLLRRAADARGRHGDLRPRRRSHARQDGGEQKRPGGVVVPGLPRQFHRTDAADRREDARRQAVRDDAVHDVPAQQSRPAAAAVARAGADAGRAAQASRHPRRGRSGRRYFMGGARHRGRRSAAAGGRPAIQQPAHQPGIPPRSAGGRARGGRKPPASMRWSRSIIPITANCARTSATGRSAS